VNLLDVDRHRPFPIPRQPWVFTQSWNDLLFAHWPVDRNPLREHVPHHLELDTYGADAWVTVAPFRLTDLSPRGVPALPWVSSFNEINLRTYVTCAGVPGVYFFSLDADSLLAVTGARTFFHLPYFLAEMSFTEKEGTLSFSSCRKADGPAEFRAQFAPAGESFEAAKGTLEYWLTERYCLYSHDSEGGAYRVHIHHGPWQLHAAEAEIVTNTLAARAAIRLPSRAPLLHFARRQDVLTWAPQKLKPGVS